MDLDDFRSVLESSGVDVWTFIDTAILVASLDNEAELRQRRDKIVERLYAASLGSRCRNCDFDGGLRAEIKATTVEKERSPEVKPRGSPSTPQSGNGDDDFDPYGGLFDDEQKRILEIKEHLEYPDQSEDSLVDLLQSLADMDITFKALQETDIGRHVNRLRKHSSNDIKMIVKHLVRKWKDIVDEWVRLNPRGEVVSSALMAYEDSPQQKISQNGHHQVPDFAYSPNPHNGSSGSVKNISELEQKPKVIAKMETPPKPSRSPLASGSAPPSVQRQREQKDSTLDSDKLALARKRLQENYKEAENAKRQRTIRVMDIHEIPKPKNAFFGKNKGGSSSHGKHW